MALDWAVGIRCVPDELQTGSEPCGSIPVGHFLLHQLYPLDLQADSLGLSHWPATATRCSELEIYAPATGSSNLSRNHDTSGARAVFV